MSDIGSVTHWVEQLKEGERDEVHKLWERYFRRLVTLARRHLQTIPRTAADEEDVAISAFHSFCWAVENGRFPKLDDRNDVWQLLIMITRRKASSWKQHQGRDRRDWKRNQPFSDATLSGTEFRELIDNDPDPQFIAEMADQCNLLFGKLEDEQLCLIARWKMEEYTVLEIAKKLNLSPSTIERRLRLIRKCWQDELSE